MNPKISVIVSTYNGERYIKETIASLLSQTFVDLELIVSNDGSTDRTTEILRGFEDNRLIVVESDQNRGIAESQNRAISLARGEYIALQDHDDLSLPGRLERQLTFLEEHRDVGLVGSACIVIDEDGKPIGEWTVPVSDIDLKWSLLIHNPFLHTTLMIRRNAIRARAVYSTDAKFSYAEDYEFISRFSTTHVVANIGESLVKWREHSSQASTRHLPTQERSCMNIAIRNMTSLLEVKEVEPSLWVALRKLLLTKVGERVTVCPDEVRNVEHHITALQEAFYQKYSFTPAMVNEHRKKLSRLMGSHFVALACKRNKGIDLSSRRALLLAGTRFLLQAVKRPAEVVSKNSVGKRVLINVMLLGPGGGATHLLHLCSALVKEGAEVTLVSRYAHRSTPLVQTQQDIPIRVVSTPFARQRRFYRLSTAWALLVWPFLLGGKKFDVLYTWELSPFTRFLSRFVLPEGRILLQRIGEPLAEGTLVDPSLESLLDGMLVETNMQAEAARRGLKRKTLVLALPLIGHCISPPERNGHHPKEPFQITFLGRYHRDKGIYRLLEIWPGLKIGKAELSFHAWGPEREQLRKSVCDLGLEDRVHVNDAYATPEELSAILAQTDLVVLPSETEGLPVVLLEAMAHGVPFVATDVGATRVLADENPDVRVVPLDNRALGQAIEEMAGAIRSGLVRSDRLQAYYQSRYGYEKLSRRWIDALLRPEQVWDSEQSLT